MVKKDKTVLIKDELQNRMEQFKKALQDEDKRVELENSIMGYEVLIRFEVFLKEQKPGHYADGLFLYMSESGEIVGAEYYIRDAEDVTVSGLEAEEFNVVKELFKDYFALEVE